MAGPRYPSLFQVNTRVRLSELSAALGRPATLDDVPDAELDRLAADGFDLVWFLGVWQTGRGGAARLGLERGVAGRVPPRPPRLPRVRRLRLVLRDPRLPGPRGLRRRRGARAPPRPPARARPPAHPRLRPEPHGAGPPVGGRAPGLVRGGQRGAPRPPAAELRAGGDGDGERVLAYGRDPYFDGWPDTFQLNYGNPACRRRCSASCGGSRRSATASAATWRCSSCPEVFERTWGIASAPFWPRATATVQRRRPGLPLHGRGLLGPRVDAAAAGLRLHLRQAALRPARARRTRGPCASTSSRASTSRTGSRASSRTTTSRARPRRSRPDVHRAAAVLTFFTPGLRFFHQGQREGKRVRIPVHLGRGPAEPPDAGLAAFYEGLLECLKDPAFRDGQLAAARVPARVGREPDVRRLRRLLLDRARETGAASSSSTTPGTRASATWRCRGAISPGATGISPTGWARPPTTAAATTSRGRGSTSTCPRGAYHVFTVSCPD